jgi:hypothetical protein
VLGTAEAAAADHVLYGWIFFSIVILLLILAGMPFREDQAETPSTTPAPPPAPGRPARLRAALATVLVIGFAASAAATSSWLDSRAAPVAPTAPPVMQAAAGCVSTGPAQITPPGTPGARHRQGSRSVEVFACGPFQLAVTVQTFSTRTNPAAIVQARRELAREDASDEMEYGTIALPGANPDSWRLTIGTTPPAMTATTLWLDGQPSRGGLGERLEQARDSIAGARLAPVLVAVALNFPPGRLGHAERERAERGLTAFLAAQAGLGAQITALARAAAGQ